MQRIDRPFIYDPSADIERRFKKSADGISTGFKQLADMKIQDYELTQNTLKDVASLKMGLNIER